MSRSKLTDEQISLILFRDSESDSDLESPALDENILNADNIAKDISSNVGDSNSLNDDSESSDSVFDTKVEGGGRGVL